MFGIGCHIIEKKIETTIPYRRDIEKKRLEKLRVKCRNDIARSVQSLGWDLPTQRVDDTESASFCLAFFAILPIFLPAAHSFLCFFLLSKSLSYFLLSVFPLSIFQIFFLRAARFFLSFCIILIFLSVYFSFSFFLLSIILAFFLLSVFLFRFFLSCFLFSISFSIYLSLFTLHASFYLCFFVSSYFSFFTACFFLSFVLCASFYLSSCRVLLSSFLSSSHLSSFHLPFFFLTFLLSSILFFFHSFHLSFLSHTHKHTQSRKHAHIHTHVNHTIH